MMNRILFRLCLISALFPASQLYANVESVCKEVRFQPADNAWVGHYYLEGVMEVGSELLLQPDGKFKGIWQSVL